VRAVGLDRFEVIETRVLEPAPPPAAAVAPSLTAHGVADATATAKLPVPLRKHYSVSSLFSPFKH
jgi:hypothetical protein